MLLFPIPILLLFVRNVHSSELNDTKLPSSSLASVSPPVNRLPNPYHVPESHIVLDFIDRDIGPVFRQSAIVGLIDKARQDILAQLAKHGDGEIPLGSHQSKFAGLAFVYESVSPHRVMKYSEVLSVIRGMSMKERYDGNKLRLATVYYLLPDGDQVETGDVALVESIRGVDTS